jgi:hypothetical protein
MREEAARFYEFPHILDFCKEKVARFIGYSLRAEIDVYRLPRAEEFFIFGHKQRQFRKLQGVREVGADYIFFGVTAAVFSGKPGGDIYRHDRVATVVYEFHNLGKETTDRAAKSAAEEGIYYYAIFV